jgi:hypothetical protein
MGIQILKHVRKPGPTDDLLRQVMENILIYAADRAAWLLAIHNALAEAQAIITAAEAKLAALGLTADDLRALGL